MNPPTVFYAPHPDDEAIGMAGAIQEQRDQGVPAILVLLTNGANRKVLEILNGRRFCTLHNTFHDFALTMDQLVLARRAEFVASATCLGVDHVLIVNEGRGIADLDSNAPEAFFRFVASVSSIIERINRDYPGASHRFPAGPNDTYLAGSTGQIAVQPTHLACWQASLTLHARLTGVRYHHVYAYLRPPKPARAQFTLSLKPGWLKIKREALDQYRLYAPEAGRFAIGSHSTKALIEAASDDPREYYDLAK